MDDSRLPLLVDNVDTMKERKIKSIDARDFILSSSSINSKTVKSISFVVCNFALWAQCVQVIWTSMQIETRWLEKGLNTNNSKTRFLSNSRTVSYNRVTKTVISIEICTASLEEGFEFESCYVTRFREVKL